MASRQNTVYPNESSHHLSSRTQDDLKASYDDLIDEYATPYDRTSRHQTYTLNTPSIGGSNKPHRGNSYPLEPKPSYSSEYTGKGGTDDGDHEEQPRGYPPPVIEPVDTRSFWDKLLPESMACRLYVLTILIETTIDLAIEGDLLVRFHQASESNQLSSQISGRKMPVYLSIFALAHVFQFVMAVDAVYTRNTLQFIFLTIFNGLFLVYAVIQIGEIRGSLTETSSLPGGISHIPIDVLTTIIPVVISVAQLVYMGLGWRIYNEFGWKVYKFLGADRRIKRMYANYQIFECLVKFDVFFWVGFSVQFIWLVLQANNWEYYVTCAALPLSLVLLVEGHLAARHENKWMMLTFMSGCVGALVYFFYKLVKVLVYRNTPQFLSVFRTLATFSVIAIILLLATFVFGIMVMRSFGKGLKTQMTKSQKSMKHNRFKSGSQLHAMSANTNRMSID